MTFIKSTYTRIESVCRNNWYPLALGLMGFPFWCLMVAAFGFLIGLSVTKYHAVAAFALTLLTVCWGCRWNIKQSVLLGVVLALVINASAVLFSMPDRSYSDDRWYHKPAVFLLRNGWNPVYQYENIPEEIIPPNALNYWSKMPLPKESNKAYITYYAKGDWITGAVIDAFFGFIYSMQCTRFLFVAASFLIAVAALHTLFRLPMLHNLILSFIAAHQPFYVGAYFDGHVDGLLGLLISVLTITLTAYMKSRDARFLPFVIFSIVYVTNIKFTGVVYAAVILLCILMTYAVLGIRRTNKITPPIKKHLFVSLSLSIALSLVAGINPYIHNLCKHHTPFYPLHTFKKGEEKEQWKFMDRWKEGHTGGANVIQQFAFFYLTRVDNPYINAGYWSDKPHGVYTSTVNKMWSIEKMGFWNDFFIMPMWFSLFALPFVRGKESWVMLIAIYASIFVQPHWWYLRYVPQIYFIPVVILCSLLAQSERARVYQWSMRWTACVVGFFLLSTSYSQLPDILSPQLLINPKEQGLVARFALQERNDVCADFPGKNAAYWFYNAVIGVPEFFPNYPLAKRILESPKEAVYISKIKEVPFYLIPNNPLAPLPELPEITAWQGYKFILKLRWRQFKQNWGLWKSSKPPQWDVPVITVKNNVLSWAPIEGATGYAVYRSITGAGKWERLTDPLTFKEIQYVQDAKSTNAGQYTYAVCACKGNEHRSRNDIQVIAVGAPKNFKAVRKGKEVVLTWSAAGQAKLYRICRWDEAAKKWIDVMLIDIAKSKATTHTLDPQGSVKFLIRCYNGRSYGEAATTTVPAK